MPSKYITLNNFNSPDKKLLGNQLGTLPLTDSYSDVAPVVKNRSFSNPASAIFKMAALPANFNFQIGYIAKNVLHDIYNYYATVYAFTTF